MGRKKKALGKAEERSEATGQQRPFQYWVGTEDSYQGRYFDQEIPTLSAVRSPELAWPLHQIRNLCGEAATAVNLLCDDAISHVTGDSGIAVADYVDEDARIKIDPETEQIVKRFLYEKLTPGTVRPWIDAYLSDGDCFVEIIYKDDLSEVDRFLHLPTWEMFRVEGNDGYLYQFEQRRHQMDEGIVFHPGQMMHFRYQRHKLYGRSIFAEITSEWAGLEEAESNWRRACRELGINPMVHIMPPCTSKEDKERYRINHQTRLALGKGSINHYYLDDGAKLANASSSQPNLQFLHDQVKDKRMRFIQRARVPPWLLGITSTGAKEIAGLPGECYSRHINSIRQTLTEGISFAIEMQLALQGIGGDQARFRLQYPQIITNPFNQPAGKTALSTQNSPEPAQ